MRVAIDCRSKNWVRVVKDKVLHRKEMNNYEEVRNNKKGMQEREI
jgi:hypothetical protein